MSTRTQHATATDEWNIAAVDVDAYLERIGRPRTEPSAETLRSLHEAHVRTIPFENVDVVLGEHPGLETGVVTDKLIGRRRGGYCYEHALLFAAVLEHLGFSVRRRMARVQPHRAGPRTHMVLIVRTDAGDHLADVGFGAGVLHPMPLEHGAVVDQTGWPHRLTHHEGVWTLSKYGENGWEALHAFDDTPQHPVDYEVAHHYTATHPNSPFTGKLVVMRIGHGVSRRLVGDELTVEHADGRVERTPVPPERLGDTLRDLDVVLDDAELERLRARLG
ncbi:arylamine N-acetyltransferase family protein [Haloactinomyces albus]|uniref:N-hydroxyarylamine O-acetyltransferase n=1 Tax=Haloactinomyces albus TaxID=1352928 RepID=A0AAE3ZBV6_9ACTN|nr:arylamine N-acetyltransferase [Haloactinomyces albus]MDR7300811.1 N-hydroxyarylamine O-acetyltransferase [Haloactinomyces albus]